LIFLEIPNSGLWQIPAQSRSFSNFMKKSKPSPENSF
jgi:hypothetical protein